MFDIHVCVVSQILPNFGCGHVLSPSFAYRLCTSRVGLLGVVNHTISNHMGHTTYGVPGCFHIFVNLFSMFWGCCLLCFQEAHRIESLDEKHDIISMTYSNDPQVHLLL